MIGDKIHTCFRLNCSCARSVRLLLFSSVKYLINIDPLIETFYPWCKFIPNHHRLLMVSIPDYIRWFRSLYVPTSMILVIVEVLNYEQLVCREDFIPAHFRHHSMNRCFPPYFSWRPLNLSWLIIGLTVPSIHLSWRKETLNLHQSLT